MSLGFLVGLGEEVGEREQGHSRRHNIIVCTKKIWRVSSQEKGENDLELKTKEFEAHEWS